ncbi:SAF domain-containing protein [Pseudonocardia adelaidensis]|uniref:SAF domain-containing protein n=1 Tax=Pseudonocardia adelaidensis TaxID=648754 RepID=A0ABP9PDS3_9PSEU
MTDSRLAPRPFSRLGALVVGPSWRRMVLLRRAAAAVLAALALVLALAPAPGSGGVPVVVTVGDVAAGSTLRPGDLTVRHWPAELVPGGALPDPAGAEGRGDVGAARAGEPITDTRLAGPAAALGAPAGAAAVPVRLADAGAAALLVPGNAVDVVTVGGSSGEPVVLATAAAVLAVLPPDSPSSGRLVLVAMPSAIAARVAAASLTEQVAVTLR